MVSQYDATRQAYKQRPSSVRTHACKQPKTSTKVEGGIYEGNYDVFDSNDTYLNRYLAAFLAQDCVGCLLCLPRGHRQKYSRGL